MDNHETFVVHNAQRYETRLSIVPAVVDPRQDIAFENERCIQNVDAALLKDLKPFLLVPFEFQCGFTSSWNSSRNDIEAYTKSVHFSRPVSLCQAAASDSSTATGTWSDGFSQARTCLSIDVPASRFAASGDNSRWSMRMPLSFCQAPA